MTASGSRRSTRSTRATSRASSSPMRSRSAARRATNSSRRRRSPRTASSTSPIPGACSTRSTPPPATSAASSGAWIPSRSVQAANRGAAFWGNLVISPAKLAGPHHRDRQEHRQGGVGDQRIGRGTHHDHRRAACHQGQDRHRRVRRRWRRPRLDGGARRRDRQAAVAQVHHSGARRARQRDLEGQDQRLADRRRRRVGDRHLRPGHQPDPVGRRQSGADDGCAVAAGRQPLHQQRHLVGPRQRQDELVLPVHARRHVGFRRGRHPHPVRTA